MENYSKHVKEDEPIILPAGFIFHPTDKELICDHLYVKVLNSNFSAPAVGEVDLNKFEPWDLPWKAKMGDYEWYFFSLMDRKSPTSQRTNRATLAGYWKATGKEIEIYMGKQLVGKKKSFVFYLGRAPNAQKTNWVLHEYKLAGIYAQCNLPNTAQNDWIICRIFLKTAGGKRIHISELMSSNPYANESSPMLPPSMDSPSSETKTTTVHETSHVTCFCGAMQRNKMQQDGMTDSFITSPASYPPGAYHQYSLLGNSCPPEFSCSMNMVNMQYPASASIQQDQSMSRMLVDNNGPITKKADITSVNGVHRADILPPVDPDNWQPPFGGQYDFPASAGAEDIDHILDSFHFLNWD